MINTMLVLKIYFRFCISIKLRCTIVTNVEKLHKQAILLAATPLSDN